MPSSQDSAGLVLTGAALELFSCNDFKMDLHCPPGRPLTIKFVKVELHRAERGGQCQLFMLLCAVGVVCED
jgi:hypothetical protein